MTTPDNELVSRAIGRARFLRDRDEIKTPELIEDLLARLEPPHPSDTSPLVSHLALVVGLVILVIAIVVTL